MWSRGIEFKAARLRLLALLTGVFGLFVVFGPACHGSVGGKSVYRAVFGLKDVQDISDFDALRLESDEVQEINTKKIILNTGVLMPILAAGTWQYDKATAEKSVRDALKAGFSHIDTAYNYNNQEGVGKAIAEYLAADPSKDRSDIFVTTKVPGCGSSGVSFENCGDDTRLIIKEDLEKLNMAYVDLLLVHFTPYGKDIEFGCGEANCEAMRHQWKAMQHAFFNKKTRSIGISNFCKECIDCLLSWDELSVLPSVNQIQYHVGMGPDPEGLVSYSESQGMVVQAYSPLGNNDKELVSGKDLSSVARKHKKTVSQVALKWIIENNVTLVTKSTNPSHMKQNLDMFSWHLDGNDMEFLDSKTTPAADPSFTCKDGDN